MHDCRALNRFRCKGVKVPGTADTLFSAMMATVALFIRGNGVDQATETGSPRGWAEGM